MKKEIQFQGMTYEIYTNDKIYGNGIQYVEISHGYQKGRGQWDHNNGCWKKQPGGYWYNLAVAEACGFIKPAVVEVPKPARKPRAKKALSPELLALQLPEGKKARLICGKIVIAKEEEAVQKAA